MFIDSLNLMIQLHIQSLRTFGIVLNILNTYVNDED